MANASFASPDAFGGTVTVSLTEALPPGASGPMLVGAANVGPRIRTHRDREDADGPKKPHRRFLGNPISASDFGSGLLVPHDKPFLLNFSGFSQGDAVQEHANDRVAALEN